jgi:CspA family cold shock protein
VAKTPLRGDRRLRPAELAAVKACIASGCEGPQPKPAAEARRVLARRLAEAIVERAELTGGAGYGDGRLRASCAKGNDMQIGTVKWFNPEKGFGFIQPEGGGADVFVHISAVERAGWRTLNEGQKISFDLVTDQRRGKTSADNLKAA